MFDRQIKNMDVQNDVNRQGALAQAIVAPITGASSGATAGAQVGGVYGAIAGGVAGAIGGGITGGMDYANTVKMMEENRQYAIDMYGYNLQNIQAMPKTLSRVSAYNIDNLYVPFIEVYDCTEIEKRALINKIIYNGMTIMRIGQLKDFVDTEEEHYYKIRLIRVNEESEDFHEYAELAAEANKGFFIVP